MSVSGLIARQDRFCEEYLLDLNATQAAIRSGYSPRSASELGYALLQNPSVQAEVADLMAERSQRVQIDQDRVVRELATVAFLDPVVMLDTSGRLLPVRAIPESARRAISSLRVVEAGEGRRVVRIRFWSKPRALELLGRHLGMFGPVAERGIDRDLAAEIEAGRMRARLHWCT